MESFINTNMLNCIFNFNGKLYKHDFKYYNH